MKYIKGVVIFSASSIIKKLLPIIYLLDLISTEILFYCYGPSFTPNGLMSEVNWTT